MPARTYVLIAVDTAQTRELVELEADTYEDLTAALRQQIRPIQGIRTTVTCLWM